ncbi:protein TIC 62, chloroplastic-like [Glycine soja]|uniref:protein TIC 62, chloroplastic-like n=1 Tax=Glycine soja TaxID=3848 RepID=UPI0003DECC39|nr:protein TIC 62, chloroplastic-like [Glycine soja]|eukprot:XP_006591559.1 protein TIC 62, chloroplastic [Glycine max]
MEAFSVQSLITVTIPSSLSCREATEKPFASHVNLSHFTSQAVEKLEIVECDLEKPETIGSALGNASTVICSIGASEKGIWKRKEEATLLASGLPYTVSDRPGNMHEAQHGRPQRKIAELMAVMAKNHDLSYCKIVNRILQLSVFQIPRLMLWLFTSFQLNYPSASVATQKETALPKPVTNQPLSPYTVYDDLKPPSSPSPSQPGDGKQTKISETVPKPSALDSPSSVLGVHGISQTTSLSEMEKPLFPYVAYPDLKPPTSSPNASTIPFSTSAGDGVPEIATVSSNGPAQLSIADEPKEEHLPEPKSRSLSPYTT